MDIEREISGTIAALDFEALAAEFHAQDQFLFLPRFLPRPLVDRMLAELRAFGPRDIKRAYMPLARKGGTIPAESIAARAPVLDALYRSPSFLDFATRLSQRRLQLKPPPDAHAAALYLYQRPGDHVGFHYDDCGCEGTASYTSTFGLVNRTTSTVHFQLFRERKDRKMKELWVSMDPGSLVFFCGSKAYHRVTPLGRREERATYSFAYVTEGTKLTGYARFQENLKDALLYFGPRALFQKNYR